MDWQGLDWAIWLGLGALLLVGEIFSLDLIMLMLAVGAFAGAVTAALTDNLVLEAVIAAVVALSMLAVVRPGLTRRLHTGPDLVLGAQKLIGERSVTNARISASAPGQIKVAGQLWTAQPYDETSVIESGTPVEVLEIRGATAYVHPIPELGAP